MKKPLDALRRVGEQAYWRTCTAVLEIQTAAILGYEQHKSGASSVQDKKSDTVNAPTTEFIPKPEATLIEQAEDFVKKIRSLDALGGKFREQRVRSILQNEKEYQMILEEFQMLRIGSGYTKEHADAESALVSLGNI